MKSEYEIVQELNELREREEYERHVRMRKLERECPEYADLVTERNALLAEAALLRLSKKTEEARKKEDEAKSLDKREREILSERGLASNYLEIWYDCPLCQDRGFRSDGSMCECLKKRIKSSHFSAYDLNERTKEDNFSNFDLSLFKDEPFKNTNLSPKKAAQVNLQKAKSYCTNYGPESKSLILSGPPGTGKTYLISCMVNELIEKDVDLIYISAHNIVQLLYDDLNSKKPYRNSNRAAFKEVELLIIDDLGAEVDTDFSRSAMSEIVDERLVSGKVTIVSTNYDIKKSFQTRYPARMTSRVLGFYERLLFVGDDLRQKLGKHF